MGTYFEISYEGGEISFTLHFYCRLTKILGGCTQVNCMCVVVKRSGMQMGSPSVSEADLNCLYCVLQH